MPFCHHKGEVRAWDIVCFWQNQTIRTFRRNNPQLLKKKKKKKIRPMWEARVCCNPSINAPKLNSPLRGDKNLCKSILCSRRSEDADTRAAGRNLRRRETQHGDRHWEQTGFMSPQYCLQRLLHSSLLWDGFGVHHVPGFAVQLHVGYFAHLVKGSPLSVHLHIPLDVPAKTLSY